MQTSIIVRLNNFVKIPNLSLCFCTAGIRYNEAREGRFLNKMWSGTKKKNSSSQPSSLKSVTNIPQNRKRRCEVLNNLFMKHITDLMATGEVAPELVGRGIDVTQVSVTDDLQFVNVYWNSRFETSFNNATEEILQRCGGQLQHELSQLRVISFVPSIRFIKDKRFFLLNEVDRRLSIINHGEEIVSTNRINKNYEPVVFTNLSPEIKSEIAKLNVSNVEEENNDCTVDLPEMRHDVLGLNSSLIMSKIQISLEKVQSNKLTSLSVGKYTENLTAEQFLSNNERRTLFKNFLKKQEIKAREKEKKSRYDVREFENYKDSADDDDNNDYDYYDNYNLIEDKGDYITEEEDLDDSK